MPDLRAFNTIHGTIFIAHTTFLSFATRRYLRYQGIELRSDEKKWAVFLQRLSAHDQRKLAQVPRSSFVERGCCL